MMLELVRRMEGEAHTHALYMAGTWPVEAANGQAAVCGTNAPRGWELLQTGGEPTCFLCVMILRGDLGRAAELMSMGDGGVPRVPIVPGFLPETSYGSANAAIRAAADARSKYSQRGGGIS